MCFFLGLYFLGFWRYGKKLGNYFIQILDYIVLKTIFANQAWEIKLFQIPTILQNEFFLWYFYGKVLSSKIAPETERLKKCIFSRVKRIIQGGEKDIILTPLLQPTHIQLILFMLTTSSYSAKHLQWPSHTRIQIKDTHCNFKHNKCVLLHFPRHSLQIPHTLPNDTFYWFH